MSNEITLHDVKQIALKKYGADNITLVVTQEGRDRPALKPDTFITEITLYPQRDGRISVTIGDD